MNYEEIRGLQEAYNQVYAPQEVEELYKGKHGQSDKEYADSRSQGGKMVSGDSKQSGAEYTHGRRVKAANPGMQPDVGGKTKPKSQGKMDRGTRADLEYRKANLKKEELELDQMIESLIERGHTEKEAYALVAQFTLDEDAGIISGLAGLALGAKGASYAAKHTKRMRDYPKNFVKGIVDPRTYGSKKKKEQKEEYVGESQEARNNPEKYEREQSKKYAPVRGEKTPMPPRGDKRREDFEKWYAKQMGR